MEFARCVIDDLEPVAAVSGGSEGGGGCPDEVSGVGGGVGDAGEGDDVGGGADEEDDGHGRDACCGLDGGEGNVSYAVRGGGGGVSVNGNGEGEGGSVWIGFN